MADGAEFKTNRSAGVPQQPLDVPGTKRAPISTVEEASRQFVPGDPKMIELTDVSRVFSVPGQLRGGPGVTKGDLLATQVVLRAMAMTMFPNSRDDEGSGGSGSDPVG